MSSIDHIFKVFRSENNAFTIQQEKMKLELKDFEQILSEYRNAQNIELMEYKTNMDNDLLNMTSHLDEVKYAAIQAKTMMRN